MENWKMHITGNLRKHPLLLALRRWGRQADSVKLAGTGLQALPYPRRCTHESCEQHSPREWGESCVCFPNTLCCVLVFGLFEEMSENRFKVSKADPDGTTEPKETYRRVNLSTDIEVNIIEPCMWHFFLWNVNHVRSKYLSYFVTLQLFSGFLSDWHSAVVFHWFKTTVWKENC